MATSQGNQMVVNEDSAGADANILARAYTLILSWPEHSQKDTADPDVVAGSGSAASDARPSGAEH